MNVPTVEIFGQRVLHPSVEELIDLVTALKQEGFNMVIDLTAVDYVSFPTRTDLPESVNPERFEVVILMINHQTRERLRLRVQVEEKNPVVPSLFDLYPGTEAMEREVFDMFGINFSDHPDLTRILMPEDWVGHPLRKDFSVGQIPVQFKASKVKR
ncbi:MAG: NADH-quinone oxidoreductase subunit 5 [Acidimicrobiaceae bacterium]|nr:MAG: NADH-quinone oxidoreductase subunit 5 [Acidimicrobiaceae bacterium]